MAKIYWPLIERDRQEIHAQYSATVVSQLADTASRVGFEFATFTIDDITIIGSPAGIQVRVRGESVRPEEAVFHTALLTWPVGHADIWRYLSTFTALEAAGYPVTVPMKHNVVANDKLLTYLQPFAADIPWLPTVRIMTRQFVSLSHHVDPKTISYPVILKPTSWGGGMGVFRCQNQQELEALLYFATAAELSMMIQPCLEGFTDVRVFCIDGEPFMSAQRVPTPTPLPGQVSRGQAKPQFFSVPEQLIEPAAKVARSLSLPYVCVDFLVSGHEFWLSELEPNGWMGNERSREQEAILQARFRAYRRLLP
jgi:glutathione synthase/RimK-type ligase-like ATP-grasp enzyme